MKGIKNSVKCLMAVFIMAAVFCATGFTANAAGKMTQIGQTKNSVTINWSAQSKAIEYYVHIGKDYNQAKAAAAVTVPASATSYTFTKLQPGTEYYAIVEYKYQGYSKTYIYNVGGKTIKTLPEKVSGVNQTKWWYYAKAVNFAWNEQDAAEYEYIIRNSKNKVVAKDTASYVNQATLSKVSNNMVYTVQVRGYVTVDGKSYYGDWSDKAYLFTQPMLKSAKISGSRLKITWNKVNGVTGYDVYVSTKEKSGYKKVKSLSSKKSSLTISKFKGKKISSKKKYYIYIVGKKKVGKKTYTSGRHYTYQLTKGKKGQLRWTFD